MKQTSILPFFVVSALLGGACNDGDDNGRDSEDPPDASRASDASVPSDARVSSDAASAMGADARIDAQVDAQPDAQAVLLDAAPVSSSDGSAALADASAELVRALDRTGVRADMARVQLVFEAYCRREVQCGARENVEACVEEQVGSATFILLSNEACIDATLDQLACTVRLGCEDDPSECFAGLETAMKACEDVFTSAD